MRVSDSYERNVFINCPFDDDYDPIFQAILFAVHRCGFVLRCAKEFGDSSSIRIHNIIDLIRQSKYSIHDLSRVGLDGPLSLPRFNMPLELGIFIGSMEFGPRKAKERKYLVIESDQFRFKQFISDISGQDIKAHEDDPRQSIQCIRNWLSHKTEMGVPSASIVWKEYEEFRTALPDLCTNANWVESELTFGEYSSLVTTWLALADKVTSS